MRLEWRYLSAEIVQTRLGVNNDYLLLNLDNSLPQTTGFNSPEESFWCCTGTGAEDFAKFNDTIYFHSEDDLYVNPFIASELDWREKDFRLRQVTRFPADQATSIFVQTGHPQERTIFLRIASWTDERAAVRVNGRIVEGRTRLATTSPYGGLGDREIVSKLQSRCISPTSPFLAT